MIYWGSAPAYLYRDRDETTRRSLVLFHFFFLSIVSLLYYMLRFGSKYNWGNRENTVVLKPRLSSSGYPSIYIIHSCIFIKTQQEASDMGIKTKVLQ